MAQRLSEELSEEECWEKLRRRTVGRLAVSVAGTPDIFPVNYRLDNGTVVVKTAPGFKLAAVALGPAVAFEVDQLNEVERSGWSVVLRGEAAEIDRLEELLDADDLNISPWAGGEKSRYIRIVPTSISGRRIPEH
jgi:nitroimidazol reductase NimA-like FMN-containing flavoprotein (pyridoxamine 5'-phosphate oxidase superfamily)